MKTALLLLALSGVGEGPIQFCGTDVPYDVLIEGRHMSIVRMSSSEDCDLVDEVATCASGRVMTVTPTNDGGIALEWPGLTETIRMPKCGVEPA